jgi:hypothetical protein
MYRVRFFMQHLDTKQKIESNEVFYDEITEFTLMLLKSERTRLETTMPSWRIFYMIEDLT